MPTQKQLMQVIRVQTEIASLGLDLSGLMQFIVDQTQTLIKADGAAIELAEDDEMVYRAASGIATPQMGLRLKIRSSLSGLCVSTGESFNCTDTENDPRVDINACRRVGLRSMIVIPLKHRDISIGVLKAMSTRVNSFTNQDITLLNMMAGVIGASMYFSAKYNSDDLFIMATHDSMTGLPNRALFLDRLRTTVAHSQREKRLSGLLMIDMDKLKHINDTHGHRVGDAAIIEFSSRLMNVTRATDTAARLGGDEFGLILHLVDDHEAIRTTTHRIESELQSSFHVEDKPFQLAASIGTAVIPHDGSHPEMLMEIADQRMYSAKRARRQRAC